MDHQHISVLLSKVAACCSTLTTTEALERYWRVQYDRFGIPSILAENNVYAVRLSEFTNARQLNRSVDKQKMSS